MDLNAEFKKIEEGQKLILNLIDGLKNSSRQTLEIYSLEDLAKMFKVTKRTIYNWKEQGILPYLVVGSKMYVTGEHLNQFIKSNEIRSNLKFRRV